MHMQAIGWLGPAILIVVIGGPLSLALLGLILSPRTGGNGAPSSYPWLALTVNSAVLYALAFNLTFFVQELFLVVPKALTPGLRPTLFHNNHTWEGDNPLENLFQGTGALAIFVMGLMALAALRRVRNRGGLAALFLAWLVYHGFMQSLPQIPTALLDAHTDVGRAFQYLKLDGAIASGLTLVALGGIALVPQWLTPVLLEQRTAADETATGWARTRLAFKVATLPALLGTLLVIPFRVPGELAAVVFSPVVIAVLGIAWIQAGAWGAEPRAVTGPTSRSRVALLPIAALAALFLFFQLVLARGVAFY